MGPPGLIVHGHISQRENIKTNTKCVAVHTPEPQWVITAMPKRHSTEKENGEVPHSFSLELNKPNKIMVSKPRKKACILVMLLVVGIVAAFAAGIAQRDNTHNTALTVPHRVLRSDKWKSWKIFLAQDSLDRDLTEGAQGSSVQYQQRSGAQGGSVQYSPRGGAQGGSVQYSPRGGAQGGSVQYSPRGEAQGGSVQYQGGGGAQGSSLRYQQRLRDRRVKRRGNNLAHLFMP